MARHPKPFFRTARAAWFVQVGKRQINLGPDKKAAFAEYHRLMAADGVATGAGAPRLNVAELCDLFLDDLVRLRKPATVDWYRYFLQRFLDHHAAKPAKDIRPYHVEAWLATHPAWNSSTRRNAITAVKRCWSWATEQGRLDSNGLAAMKRPPMRRREVMSDEGAAKFLAAMKPGPLRDFAVGLAETGCRPGELIGLAAADVDLGKSTMAVTGKAGRRTVVLVGKAHELLARLMAEHPEGDLFRNRRGQPWSAKSLRCAFRRERIKAGVDGAVPYAFRHLFGSQAIERGVDSLLVAELMGHKNVRMLQQHYAHHKTETLRAAAERARQAGGSDAGPT